MASEMPTPVPPGGYTFSPTPNAYLQDEAPLEAAGRKLQEVAIGEAPLPDQPLKIPAETGRAPELSQDVPQPTAATMLESGGAVNESGMSDDAALASAFLAAQPENESGAAKEVDRPALTPLATPGAGIGEPSSNLAPAASELPVATLPDGSKQADEVIEPVKPDNVSSRAVVGAPVVATAAITDEVPPVRSPVDDEGRTNAQRLVDEVEGKEHGSLPPALMQKDALYTDSGLSSVTGASSALPEAPVTAEEPPISATEPHVVGLDKPTHAPPLKPEEHKLRDVGFATAGASAGAAGLAAAEFSQAGVPEVPVSPEGHIPNNPGDSGLTAMNAQEKPTTSVAAVERHALSNQTAIGNTPLATAVPSSVGPEPEKSDHPIASSGNAKDDAPKLPAKGLKALGYNAAPASDQRADPKRLSQGSAPPSPRQATHGSPQASHDSPRASGEHRKLHTHRHPHGPPPVGVAPPTPPKDVTQPPATSRPQGRRRSSASSLGKKTSGFMSKILGRKRDKSKEGTIQ